MGARLVPGAAPTAVARRGGWRVRRRQVLQQRLEVAAGASREGGLDPLLVLLDGEPTIGEVAGQNRHHLVALGLRHPQVRIAPFRLVSVVDPRPFAAGPDVLAVAMVGDVAHQHHDGTGRRPEVSRHLSHRLSMMGR